MTKVFVEHFFLGEECFFIQKSLFGIFCCCEKRFFVKKSFCCEDEKKNCENSFLFKKQFDNNKKKFRDKFCFVKTIFIVKGSLLKFFFEETNNFSKKSISLKKLACENFS